MDEQAKLFRGLFDEFAREVVAPLADELDREERPPKEALRQAGELELLGIPHSQEWGGGGLGMVEECLLLEAVGGACLATALTMASHTACGLAIERGGTDAQRRRFLPPLSAGKRLGGYGPREGGDLALASEDGESGLVCSGPHRFVVNGGIADLVVLFAAEGSGIQGFVLEEGSPGAWMGPPQKKMGVRGADTREMVLERVPVLPEQLLTGTDDLSREVSALLGVMIGAMCLGLAEAAYAASLRFARTREQFGGPIARKGAVQAMIADMQLEIEGLRALVDEAARRLDDDGDGTRLAAVAKVLGSEVAGRVVNRAVQLHGGSGYVRDFPIERLYRDARMARLFPAPNEWVRRDLALQALGESATADAP